MQDVSIYFEYNEERHSVITPLYPMTAESMSEEFELDKVDFETLIEEIRF